MQSLIQLRQNLVQDRHRQLVVLSGSLNWQQKQLSGLFSQDEELLIINSNSDTAPLEVDFAGAKTTSIATKQLAHLLGQEIDGAIFSSASGLSADSIGIVSGMIKAGGLLIILTPDVPAWRKQNNPEDSRFLNTPITLHQSNKLFTQHLINSFQNSEAVWLHEKSSDVDTQPTQKTRLSNQSNLPTEDQLLAIQSVHKVAFGHRKRPLVICADRGRGKTASLGLAAIECLTEGKQHVVITASRPDQVNTAFKQASAAIKLLGEQLKDELEILIEKHNLLEFRYKGELKTFEYLAPDQLILKPTSADLLMVDEAAHLPNPLLAELLKRHHRMVFSTTLHGYEGSGRGFELRFKQHLNQQTPNWKLCEMKTPIRWAEHDPLEKIVFDALLLNAQTPELDDEISSNPDNQQIEYKTVSAQELLNDKTKLESVFGILVQAHYQTSPNDLQQLLNAPNIEIVIAEAIDEGHDSVIVGAALCVAEGKINPVKGRAHGHLIPQLLTKHYAQQDFMLLSTLRIMRIAVHPELQRQKIGHNLIRFIEKLGQQKRIDYLSSSFGGSDELLTFWFQESFWPLHVGVKRDKASGSHNIVVAKPISAMSRQALSMIQNRFQEQFPHLLFESLPNLSASQILQIMQTFRFKKTNYGLEKAMSNYSNGERPYESISIKLWEWSLHSACKIYQSSPTEQEVWCDKILKTNSWESVAHRHHLAGRKSVETALKTMIKKWLDNSNANLACNRARGYN